jgi:glucuronate isomerase
MAPSAPLILHPDRLLPADPGVRALARQVYDGIKDLPIISPHGHVDPHVLLHDEAFADPATLLITPDHYVTRLMHGHGVDLSALGVGQGPLDEAAARAVWRTFCEHWDVYLGTPVRSWLESELAELFGVTVQPSAATADVTYDQIAECLALPEFRPRTLFRRFGISALATTDDPCDDLSAHAALRADPEWAGRVIPTFRPDRYLEVSHPDWPARINRLGEVSDVDADCYAGWVTAMERRRAFFQANGAVSTDHSHEDVWTTRLDPAQAERHYADALGGRVAPENALALRRHMLFEQARMAADDGLTMTIHPGVRRDHHSATFERFGADVGADIPLRCDFVDALRPMLDHFGTHPNFTVVLFTMDESVLSREVAPLAGFYPSVYVGAAWWFLDEPDAIRRWRSAVTAAAGLRKTSGFVDDTRAFCSIPARHDMSRRLDAGFLAGLVAEHRMSLTDAVAAGMDLVAGRPAEVFHL